MQSPVRTIEKRVRSLVIYRSYPFTLKYTPKNLGRIKFWRIRWKIEEVQSSFLPNFPQFFHLPISMNRSIVQDNYSLLRDIERESIKIVHNLVCVDGLFCGKAPWAFSYTFIISAIWGADLPSDFSNMDLHLIRKL